MRNELATFLITSCFSLTLPAQQSIHVLNFQADNGFQHLAVRIMPFGIAFRSSIVVKEINNFDYLNSQLNVSYFGSGKIKKIQ